MLRQPTLGGSGHTEEKQRPVRREGRHRNLHEPAVPDVFRGDVRPVLQAAAHHERHHRPRREAPAGRSLLLVEAGKGFELVGPGLLGVGAQDDRWCRGHESPSGSQRWHSCERFVDTGTESDGLDGVAERRTELILE